MGTLHTLARVASIALILVGLTISIISYFENIDDESREELLSKLTDSPAETLPLAGKFFIAYDFITPSIITEWFGSDEKTTFLLEDLPVPSSRDVIILFLLFWYPLFLIGAWYLRKAVGPQDWLIKLGILLLIFLVVTFILWAALKLFAYYVMVENAEALGFDLEEVRSLRVAESQKSLEIYGVRGIVTIFVVFSGLALWSLTSKKKEG